MSACVKRSGHLMRSIITLAFWVSAQMSELIRKTVSKLLVDCFKWMRPKLQSLWRRWQS